MVNKRSKVLKKSVRVALVVAILGAPSLSVAFVNPYLRSNSATAPTVSAQKSQPQVDPMLAQAEKAVKQARKQFDQNYISSITLTSNS